MIEIETSKVTRLIFNRDWLQIEPGSLVIDEANFVQPNNPEVLCNKFASFRDNFQQTYMVPLEMIYGYQVGEEGEEKSEEEVVSVKLTREELEEAEILYNKLQEHEDHATASIMALMPNCTMPKGFFERQAEFRKKDRANRERLGLLPSHEKSDEELDTGLTSLVSGGMAPRPTRQASAQKTLQDVYRDSETRRINPTTGI